MSWRLVATIMIAIFSILTLSVVTAGPLHQATGAITEMDDGTSEHGLDTDGFVNAGLQAYSDMILIFVFGLIAYGAWYLLRRELSAGRL